MPHTTPVLPLIAGLLLFSAFTSAQNQNPSPPAKAGVELQKRTVEHPDLARASDLIDKGRYADAVSELTTLRAVSPSTKGIAHQLGAAYFKQGDYARAYPELRKAIAENPEDKEAIQLLGLAYYFIGRPKDAIPLLEKVQSWYQRANVDAAYVLGNCYIQVADYEGARKSFATMYGVPPDSPESHLFLSRMLMRQNFDSAAEEEARKAAMDPKLPMVHFLLGELYMFKSRIPESIAEFEAELTLNPGYAATYYRLADAYTRIGRWEDAERLLQRSIWLDSTASGPYILMTKVLLHKGEAALAKRSIDRALTMDPNNYLGHYLLGQVYQAQGMSTDAAKEFAFSQQLQAKQNHSENEKLH